VHDSHDRDDAQTGLSERDRPACQRRSEDMRALPSSKVYRRSVLWPSSTLRLRANEAKHRLTTNVYCFCFALAGLGGDGPKMVELEQMREQHLLQDRIVLLGAVSPNDVHSVSRL
jgi:hypothetical protein